MKDLKLAAAAVLAVAVLIFVLQNADPIRVAFFVWSWSASGALVLLVVFLVGVAIGWLARTALYRRRR